MHDGGHGGSILFNFKKNLEGTRYLFSVFNGYCYWVSIFILNVFSFF